VRATAVPTPNLRNIFVVIVDDDSPIRKLLVDLLDRMGFLARGFSNAIEFLNAISIIVLLASFWT
jgi:FixJ family two-component response regulator